MQLSRLIARLSKDDRATLIERRLGPDVEPIADRALVEELARPGSVATALTKVNQAQLLLLRWLAVRPDFTARFGELVEALGDRLSPELRDAYLRDLRLWGLADYERKGADAFFATYPAVVSNVGFPRGILLRDPLNKRTTDVLLKVCSALGLRTPPTRKEQRIEVIARTLSTTASCRAVVQALPATAQELFAWVRERGGHIGADEMERRAPTRQALYRYGYGGARTYWEPRLTKEPLEPLFELSRRALVVPLTPYGDEWSVPTAFAIPDEVEVAYGGGNVLDSGPLTPPPLRPAEGVSGSVPDPAALLRDIAHLLGFVRAGRVEWRQDGGPYKRSLTALAKLLRTRDADGVERLWDLALSAGLLRPVRRGASGYEVPDGIGATADELLRGVLVGWIDGRGRPDVGPPGRAQTARLHIVELLQTIPPDTWLLRSSVDAWLQFHWPATFTSTRQFGPAVPTEPEWAILSQVILGTGTTPGGQPAVLLPAAHQALISFGLGDSMTVHAGHLPPWDDVWIVQPDRTVVVPPNAHPDAIVQLWQVAQLESNQGASVFRITPETVAGALNRGMTPAEVRTLLESRSKVPLPPTVERLIGDQGARYGRIRVGTAHTYVRTDDPALLEELRRNPKLKDLTLREVAPGLAFIEGLDPTTVMTALRKAGQLPVLDADEQKPKNAGAAGASAKVADISAAAAPDRPGSRPPPGPLRIIAPGAGDIIAPASEPKAIARMVRDAIRDGNTLDVTWIEDGDEVTAELEPIDLHGQTLHASNLDDGEDEMIPLSAITLVSLGEPFDEDEDDLPPIDSALISQLERILLGPLGGGSGGGRGGGGRGGRKRK